MTSHTANTDQVQNDRDSPPGGDHPCNDHPPEGDHPRNDSPHSSSSTQAVTPPDGGWGWMVVMSSFVVSVCVDGVCFSVGIFFNTLRQHFHSTKADTAWVGSVLNGSYLIVGPVVSAFVNRYGCRRTAMFGSLFASVSFFVSTFSPTLPTLIFTYGLLGGIGFGFVYLPAMVMVGYYFEKRRALATGIACCGSGIGAFVFAPLCSLLLDEYGWKGATWIISGLVLNAVIFSIFYRPLTESKMFDVKHSDTENNEFCSKDKSYVTENGEFCSEQTEKLLATSGQDTELTDQVIVPKTSLSVSGGNAHVVSSTSMSVAGDTDLNNSVHSASTVRACAGFVEGGATALQDALHPIVVGGAVPDIILEIADSVSATAEMGEDGQKSAAEDKSPLHELGFTHTELSSLIQTVAPKIPASQSARSKAFLSDFQLTESNQDPVARLALSQGALCPERKQGLVRRPRHSRHNQPHHLHVGNPLQRKDIFYSGSLRHIPEYTSSDNLAEYRRKVTKSDDIEEEENSSSSEEEKEKKGKAVGKKSFLARFVCNPLRHVFDFSLLKSPTFIIYGLSCTLCMAGFFVPFMYLPTLCMDLGISQTDAALLISLMGVANTVGRVAAGFVSDQSWADCLLINNVALLAAGVATVCVPFLHLYALFATYSFVFGTTIAVFVSLRTIIMVELMGLQKLTNAFGLVIMCQGISSFVGAPIAGLLSDVTGNYNSSFYVAGLFLALAGAICLPLRRIARWEQKKEREIINKCDD